MRSCKEYRQWISWLKSKYSKPNGVIPEYLLDNPWLEIKDANSKKNYRRLQNKKTLRKELDYAY